MQVDSPYRGRNYPFNEPPEKFHLLEDKIIREVLLPAEPFMQPSPKRNPGGDCFACMTAGVFRAMFPEKKDEITFDMAFESWMIARNQNGDKVLGNTYNRTRDAMHEMAEKVGEVQVYAQGGFARYADPTEYSGAHWSACYAQDMVLIEAFLSAGWYLLFEISADPKPPINPDGSLNSHDHFVYVNGYRKRYSWQEQKFGDEWMKSGGWQEYYHVMCSKYGPYWIDEQTFTRMHGAANFWAIRRRAEGDHF